MALFSRRNKSADEPEVVAPAEAVEEAPEAEAPAPTVNISMDSFRGLGSTAAPSAPPAPASPATPGFLGAATTTSPAQAAPVAPAQGAAAPLLPLAAANPPAQTESVAGMKDNVLLRETLARLGEKPTNEQLLGVLRQMLQGHLYLRVQGDARQLISEGKPLSIGTITDAGNTYLMAFSSAAALQKALKAEPNAAPSSAIAQPVQAVLTQVAEGPFAGIVLDSASSPHRAVFPKEILVKALEQADAALAIKGILALPRTQESVAKVAELLATTRMWVAVNSPEGSEALGIAEARMADGRRFMQLYTHPLEVVALGRGDRPMPFLPEQLGKVFTGHGELAGVVIDPAGPTLVVERDALDAVVAVAAGAKGEAGAEG